MTNFGGEVQLAGRTQVHLPWPSLLACGHLLVDRPQAHSHESPILGSPLQESSPCPPSSTLSPQEGPHSSFPIAKIIIHTKSKQNRAESCALGAERPGTSPSLFQTCFVAWDKSAPLPRERAGLTNLYVLP